MGVGLRSLWRFRASDNLEYELSEAIRQQISEYLPELTGVKVEVELANDHMLHITIDTTDGLYTYAYDRNEDKLIIADRDNMPLSAL